MPNVVRFTLSTARTLDVPGAGTFHLGVLDVDANDLRLVARTRYKVQAYGAVEVGIVDSATAYPSLPAVPASPNPDPYPQYATIDEVVASTALRAAFGLAPVAPIAVPLAPTSVLARARSTSVVVTWTPPVGPTVDSYTVTASPGGATATTSGTSAVVTGLTNGTAYTFTVKANNAVGAGASSSASNSATPSPQPGGLSSITDLVAWWDAGQIPGPPANGAAVGTWSSVAGNGFTAAQPTGSDQPLFVSSWTNGKPALAFTAIKEMPTTLTQADIGGAMTVFVACDSTGSGLQRVLMNQAFSGDATGNFVDTVTGATWRVGTGDAQGLATAANSATPEIISLTAPGYAYFNGAKASPHLNPATKTATPYWISGTPGQDWGLVGRVAEVIIYGRVLSAAERHQVESYLAAKYNVTVVAQ